MVYLSNSNCYYDYNNNYYCGNSRWYSWGRWVLLGIIVAAALLLLFSVMSVNYRRRKGGTKPIPYTGWMMPPPYSQSQQQYQQPDGYHGAYNQNQYATYGDRPTTDSYGPPTGPPPQHYDYQAPEGPPPSDYAPPSYPPPAHKSQV